MFSPEGRRLCQQNFENVTRKRMPEKKMKKIALGLLVPRKNGGTRALYPKKNMG